jgi:hypothetical protein
LAIFWGFSLEGRFYIEVFHLFSQGGVLKKTILFRVGAKEFQWPSVLGIFLAIITILMFVKAAAVMFDSWQTVRDFDKCVVLSGVNDFVDLSSSEQLLAQLRYSDCKDSLYQITGTQMPALQTKLTTRQVWTALAEPVAWLFFWGAVLFLLAFPLLLNKPIVIPIEEYEVPVRPFSRKR